MFLHHEKQTNNVMIRNNYSILCSFRTFPQTLSTVLKTSFTSLQTTSVGLELKPIKVLHLQHYQIQIVSNLLIVWHV